LEVRFRTRRLQRCFADSKAAARTWGPEIGERYAQRIRTLVGAPTLDALYETRALGFHPLTGNRRGQYAVRLTGQMRLIVTVANRRVIWIEEVVDYHG
jgi:proteic killer suppression protein